MLETLLVSLNMGNTVNFGNNSIMLGLTCLKEFFNTRQTLCNILTGNTACVESTHCELSTRLTYGLSSNDTNSLTDFNFRLVSQIPAIALLADTKLTLASQNRPYRDSVTNFGNFVGKFIVNSLIDIANLIACFRIHNIFSKHPADNTILQALNNAAAFFDSLDLNAANRMIADIYLFGVTRQQIINELTSKYITDLHNVLGFNRR